MSGKVQMGGNPEELSGAVVVEVPVKEVFNSVDSRGVLRFETVKELQG